MEDLKTKVKTRGVAAILEDREQLFTLKELSLAIDATVLEVSRKHGWIIPLTDAQEVKSKVLETAQRHRRP
jgi:hypothetical protein